MIKIRYKGGRSCLKVVLNRIPYYFNKENNRVLDIKDQAVINYIFSLDNRAEFEVVAEEPKQEEQKVSLPEMLSQPVENILKKKAGRPKKGER